MHSMEHGSGEYGLNTEGGGREGGFDTEGEVALYILQVQNDFRTDVPQNV